MSLEIETSLINAAYFSFMLVFSVGSTLVSVLSFSYGFGSSGVHDPTDSGNTRTANAEECCYDGIKKKQELECNTWLGNKRFRGTNSGLFYLFLIFWG